jgi:hypothetical protein
MVRVARKRKTDIYSRFKELRANHPLRDREFPPIRATIWKWVDRWQLNNFIQRISPFQSETSERGPLMFVILAETGQDVRTCSNCRNCEDWMTPAMDLNFGEILRAAGRNDPLALKNQSLWNCDDAFSDSISCQEGFDITAVIRTLRHEAKLRGYHKRFYRLRALPSRIRTIPRWRPSTFSVPSFDRERLESLRRKLEILNRFKS